MPHKLCEHNKRKERCVECGGSSVCEHKRLKSQCKECKGGSICEHNKRRTYCKDCKGGALCEHSRERSKCKDCGGKQICEHKRFRAYCKECKGVAICEHNRVRYACKKCKGASICEHNRERSKCKECGGGAICKHNKHRSYCKECGGTSLCKSSWCETKASNPKYEGHCFHCFVHLYPDRPTSKNIKTKEKAVIEYVYTNYPLDKYSWVVDRKIYDGCSKRRPDLFLDLGYQVVIIEIDENQHQYYDCSCDNKRLMEISKDINHRPLIFIRFNPDDYLNEDNKKVTSCWSISKNGICSIKKTKTREWLERLEALKQQIEYWIAPENITEKTVQIVHMFYDYVSN